jgi:rhodanese-related sulfurtransferase
MDVRGADFNAKTALLDKARPVAVYCRSGARSKTAARKLSEAGFQVIDLDKGFANWNGEVKK